MFYIKKTTPVNCKITETKITTETRKLSYRKDDSAMCPRPII